MTVTLISIYVNCAYLSKFYSDVIMHCRVNSELLFVISYLPRYPNRIVDDCKVFVVL